MFRGFPTISAGEVWDIFTNSVLRSVRLGKLNNVGEVTLEAGTSTTLTDDLIGPDSLVSLTATDAAGAALGAVWVDGYDKGSCEIHHASAAGTEVFRYCVLG